MSATGLEVFDKTLHTTNAWLQEMMAELGPDRQVAWHALGAVLRPLRDRIPVGLAVHLGSELPILVRGSYYEQWQPERTPEKSRSLDAFLERVSAGLADTRPLDAREATLAVFHVLSRHVDRGQLKKVRDLLPEELREFWPESFLDEAPRQVRQPPGAPH